MKRETACQQTRRNLTRVLRQGINCSDRASSANKEPRAIALYLDDFDVTDWVTRLPN
ncbi:MAG: hypothetical protein GVY04_13495 [Cyanobacteria bacterium]|nr:hypothetical protein [Cyanobacteria bacterium GSL.Bin1]